MTLAPPSKLYDLQSATQDLLAALDGTTWKLIMKIAGDSRPVQQAHQIMNETVYYIKTWLMGPEVVANTAKQWASITGQFQTVVDDCQTQLDVLGKHWSGEAAETFSSYSGQLMKKLGNGGPATNQVQSNLSALGANLTKLRGATIAEATLAIIDLVKDGISLVNTAVNGIDPKMLVGAVIFPPLAVVQYCLNVVNAEANMLADALKHMVTMARTLNDSLADMRSSATQMSGGVHSLLGNDGVPSEPHGIGDTKGWKPA